MGEPEAFLLFLSMSCSETLFGDPGYENLAFPCFLNKESFPSILGSEAIETMATSIGGDACFVLDILK
jgi:hypothetical protein